MLDDRIDPQREVGVNREQLAGCLDDRFAPLNAFAEIVDQAAIRVQ